MLSKLIFLCLFNCFLFFSISYSLNQKDDYSIFQKKIENLKDEYSDTFIIAMVKNNYLFNELITDKYLKNYFLNLSDELLIKKMKSNVDSTYFFQRLTKKIFFIEKQTSFSILENIKYWCLIHELFEKYFSYEIINLEIIVEYIYNDKNIKEIVNKYLTHKDQSPSSLSTNCMIEIYFDLITFLSLKTPEEQLEYISLMMLSCIIDN